MAKLAIKKKKGGIRFFKVMLPGYLNELSIPPKFVRNAALQNHRAAIIRDPLGRSWHTNIEGKGEALWFCGQGWMNFIKGLDIGLGFFLIFKYKGNLKFHVKVFDLTACELEYSREICNYLQRCSGRSAEMSEAPLNKQAQAKASRKAERLFRQFCRSLGPHFSITLKFCNLRSQPYLNVPLRFLASHNLDSKSKVMLIDPKGRSSQVRIKIRKRRPVVQCCFGKGWHEFCLNNHLSAGDKCIFELKTEEPDAYILHVHIFRE